MAPRQLLTSRAVIGEFYNRLEQGNAGWATRLAMKISSNQASENYAWLGMSPTMREWIGGRHAKDLAEFSFRIDNKEHEATLKVKRHELRRDNSGQLMLRIQELADRTNAYPAKLLSTLIVNGESATCYDGQFFFDTDHAEGDSGTQSNDITSPASTPAAPTVPEMRNAIMAGVQAVLGFKDDRGEPMNENARRFEVMVPTSLFATAVSAITLPVIDAGAANIIPALTEFQIIPVINPRLPWTTKLMVARTDGMTKPFILQEEVPVEVAAVAEGTELEFTYNEHHYGVYWAGNVGYGYWQHACLVTFT